MNIEKIPTEELRTDREESIIDIRDCRFALSMGKKKYSGGRIADRLETNQKIIVKIDKELKRREAQ